MTNIIVAIFMVIAQAIGLGGDINAKLEQAVKAELGQKVEAVDVETHINKGSLISKGKIAQIDLELTGLWMKPVRVERSKFELKDIRISTAKVVTGKAKRSINSVGDVNFRMEFLPKDLSRAIELDSDKIRDPKITLKSSAVIISGKYPVGMMSVPFEVEGYLTYEGGSRIFYRISRAKVVGLGLPGGVKQSIENELNPIFDIDKFEANKRDELEKNEKLIGRKLDLVIRNILVTSDRIIITGSI
jgi:hypothetical protein